MMKFERHKVEQPTWLSQKWQKWGEQATKIRDKGKEVNWYTYQKRPINQHLIPLLREISDNHCAFCDGYPMQQMVEHIEHFKPKSKYPELSHQWENLFIICEKCNITKSDDFDELLLKPDENDYSFSRYFTMNPDGILEADITLNLFEKSRVDKTIELYGLNEHGRPEERINELNNNNSNKTGIYRFIYL